MGGKRLRVWCPGKVINRNRTNLGKKKAFNVAGKKQHQEGGEHTIKRTEPQNNDPKAKDNRAKALKIIPRIGTRGSIGVGCTKKGALDGKNLSK